MHASNEAIEFSLFLAMFCIPEVAAKEEKKALKAIKLLSEFSLFQKFQQSTIQAIRI